jgi:transcriptional regulator with XRE-family HTH domain
MNAPCQFRSRVVPAFKPERFAEVLSKAGLTQKVLAERSRVSQSLISQYLNAKVKDVKASHLFRIAGAIGVTCLEFTKDVGEPIEWLAPDENGC